MEHILRQAPCCVLVELLERQPCHLLSDYTAEGFPSSQHQTVLAAWLHQRGQLQWFALHFPPGAWLREGRVRGDPFTQCSSLSLLYCVAFYHQITSAWTFCKFTSTKVRLIHTLACLSFLNHPSLEDTAIWNLMLHLLQNG